MIHEVFMVLCCTTLNMSDINCNFKIGEAQIKTFPVIYFFFLHGRSQISTDSKLLILPEISIYLLYKLQFICCINSNYHTFSDVTLSNNTRSIAVQKFFLIFFLLFFKFSCEYVIPFVICTEYLIISLLPKTKTVFLLQHFLLFFLVDKSSDKTF